MDDIFERMKKRTEQLGGFINRILSPKNSNFPGISDTQTPQSTPLTDDMYDDTGVLGKNSRVMDYWKNCHPPRRMPSEKPEFQDKRPLVPFEEGGSLFPPDHRPESMLEKAFGGMFDSVFGGMMEDMNNAMSEMDAALSEFDNDMDEEDDEHRYSRFFGQGFPLQEMDESADGEHTNPKKFIDPNGNYRDQVLKREGDGNTKNLVPRTWTSPSYPNTGSSSWNWSSSGTTTIYSSVNGKVSSQTIRETPEGREIITQRQNEQGITEERREFIPRKDLPPQQSIFTKLFRPKS